VTFDQARHHLTIPPTVARILISWFRLRRGREMPDRVTPIQRPLWQFLLFITLGACWPERGQRERRQ
jgi:hypothetical protein